MNFSGLYGKRKHFIKETSKPFWGVFHTCWIIFYEYYYIYVIASWGCCTLFELKEIVYQSSDLEFVELLNWLRENTEEAWHGDLEWIQVLAYAYTSDCFENSVKFCLTNHLARAENEESIAQLNSRVFINSCSESTKDLQAGKCFAKITQVAM